MKKDIYYFPKPGPQNTDETLRAALERARALGIKKIVVATNTGKTPLRLLELIPSGEEYEIIAVSVSAHTPKIGLPPERKAELVAKGIKVIHAYSGAEGALERGDIPYPNVERSIAAALSTVSTGLHAIFWCVLAALDQGLINPEEEVIAVAGTGSLGGGADTAVVIKAGYPYMLFDRTKGMKIKEIIAMPRERG